MMSLWIGLVVYLALCALTAVAGQGLLRLMGLKLPPRAAWLLAPVLTFVAWSVLLGVIGATPTPMKQAAPWVWGLTGLLAAFGCLSFRKARPALALLGLCGVLPVLVLLPAFRAGTTEELYSRIPDGWWYLAMGQNLWDHGHGEPNPQGPLSTLAEQPIQRDVRYITHALLALLSPLTAHGDAQAAYGLYQAWVLFCLGCAIACFWVSISAPWWEAAAGTVLTVASGWIGHVVYIYNLDNCLALVYLPAIAALVRLLSVRDWRLWLILGAMTAGLTYTYPQGAPFILFGGALLILPRLWQERAQWRYWLAGAAAALGLAVLLVLPGWSGLVATTKYLYEASLRQSGAGWLPGEGCFHGLVVPPLMASAAWGLGGEILQPNALPRTLLAITLTVLAVVGLIVQLRRRWELVAVVALFGAGTAYFIFRRHYDYGAYKWLNLGWWALIALVVTGASWLCQLSPGRILKGAFGITLAAAGLFMVFQYGAVRKPVATDHPQAELRELQQAARVVGDEPVAILVDDFWRNLWAMYYLRDERVSHVRWMPQQPIVCLPEVRELIGPAAPFASHVRYVLMDNVREPALSQWQLAWSGGPFRLWKPRDKNWALVSEIINVNGLDVGCFCMGNGDTKVQILASAPCTAHLQATFIPGPSIPDSAQRRLLVITEGCTPSEFCLDPGVYTISVPVRSGVTTVVLRTVDPPALPRLANGDPRPLILVVKGLTATWGPAGEDPCPRLQKVGPVP
jgi:hypothetical protein